MVWEVDLVCYWPIASQLQAITLLLPSELRVDMKKFVFVILVAAKVYS